LVPQSDRPSRGVGPGMMEAVTPMTMGLTASNDSVADLLSGTVPSTDGKVTLYPVDSSPTVIYGIVDVNESQSGGEELQRQLFELQGQMQGLEESTKTKETLWRNLMKKKDQQLTVTLKREKAHVTKLREKIALLLQELEKLNGSVRVSYDQAEKKQTATLEKLFTRLRQDKRIEKLQHQQQGLVHDFVRDIIVQVQFHSGEARQEGEKMLAEMFGRANDIAEIALNVDDGPSADEDAVRSKLEQLEEEQVRLLAEQAGLDAQVKLYENQVRSLHSKTVRSDARIQFLQRNLDEEKAEVERLRALLEAKDQPVKVPTPTQAAVEPTPEPTVISPSPRQAIPVVSDKSEDPSPLTPALPVPTSRLSRAGNDGKKARKARKGAESPNSAALRTGRWTGRWRRAITVVRAAVRLRLGVVINNTERMDSGVSTVRMASEVFSGDKSQTIHNVSTFCGAQTSSPASGVPLSGLLGGESCEVAVQTGQDLLDELRAEVRRMRKQGRRGSKGRRTSKAPHLPPVRGEAEEGYYSSSSSSPDTPSRGQENSGKPQVCPQCKASMRHTGSKQKGDLVGLHRRSMKKQGEKPHEVDGFGGSGPGTPQSFTRSQIDASPRSDAPVVHLPVTPANPRAKTGTRASFHRQAKESRASFARQAKEAEDPEPTGQRSVHTATWTLDGVMNRPAPPNPEKRNSSVREGRQQQLTSARVDGNPKRRSTSRHSIVRQSLSQSPRMSTIGLSGSPQQEEESSLQQLFRDAADALGQSLPPLPPTSQPPDQPPGRRASPKKMGL